MSVNYLPASILISLTDTLHSVARGLLLNILCSFPLVLGEKEGWSKFSILTSLSRSRVQTPWFLISPPSWPLSSSSSFFLFNDRLFLWNLFPYYTKILAWWMFFIHPSSMMHELQYFRKQQVTLTIETFLSRNLSPGCLWNPTHAPY